MKFTRIGNTRWVNVGTGHIVSITAHAGRSIVKLTDGEAITDNRTPEVLIEALEALSKPEPSWTAPFAGADLHLAPSAD